MTEKITAIFNKIGSQFSEDFLINRLGKPSTNPAYHRVIKVGVGNKGTRDNILLKAKELKNAGDIWSKVYLKRDQHPIIIQENKRLWKKKKELEKLEENKDKLVKLEKGKLSIDGLVVDKNLFFV